MTAEDVFTRLLWLLDNPWVIWIVLGFWLAVGAAASIIFIDEA